MSEHPPTAATPIALRINLLGGFSVAVGPSTVPDRAWSLRRARTLVKLLALAPRHRLHREQVVDALWGERIPSDPGNSLHQVVRAARQALATAPPDAHFLLVFEGEQLLLAAPSSSAPGSHLTDVETFEAAAAHAAHDGSVAAYRTAIALYTGDLLPEDRYADWAAGRRVALSSKLVELLLGLARALEAQQAHAEAVEALRRVVRSDPTHEEARVQLMRLHALRGSPGEAEREYQALAAALADIGARPGPMSQQVRADIQSGRLVAPHPVAPSSLPAEPSAISDTGARATQTTNLPFETSRFIGRSRETSEVVALLAESRLVTITGVGGGGKTRLALHVARSLAGRFGDGAWLVELAALAQPSLVPQAVAAALRVPERADTSATETLISALEGKRLLLVLDNCEHLIEASAQLADTLLRRCPGLRVLCTSREPLHIAGEVVWRIAALSLPDPRRLPDPPAPADLDRLTHYESVELFLDRARAAHPSFAMTGSNAQTIVQICRRLDGLPLAIELAAALVGNLPLEQIAAQLDRCFDLLVRGSRTALTRQQTLRGALDWSYDLLPEDERAVFRRLAVFAGSFDLAAAHAVASLDEAQGAEQTGQSGQTWTRLNDLVDKSLVVADTSGEEARYRLLEPVRQNAERRLAEAGEANRAHLRHARWYAQWCERADAALWGAEHEGAMARLEANRANVRAALGWWLRDPATAEDGLRQAQALWQFWLLRGAFAEGRSWLERLSALVPRVNPWRAQALMSVAGLGFRQGNYGNDQTGSKARESAEIYRALDDLAGAGRAVRLAGMLAYIKGDVDQAVASFVESQELFQEADEPGGEVLALHALGILAWLRGELDEARVSLERSLHTLRCAGSPAWTTLALMNAPHMPFTATSSLLELVQEETWVLLRAIDLHAVEAYTLAHLGNLARCQRDFTSAHALQEEARHLFEAHGDREGVAQVAGQLGNLARVEGDLAAARAYLHESLRLRRALGDRRGMFITSNNLGLLSVAEGDYQRAEELFARGYVYSTQFGDGSALYIALDLQAHLALVREDFRRARQLYQRLLDLAFRMVTSTYDQAYIRARLGEAALKQGDVAAARAYYAESLDNFERLHGNASATLTRAILASIAEHPPSAR